MGKRKQRLWGIGALVIGIAFFSVAVFWGALNGWTKHGEISMQQDNGNYTDWIEGVVGSATERGYIIDIEQSSEFANNLSQFEINKQVFTGREEFSLESGQNVRVMLNGIEIDWEDEVPFVKTVFDVYLAGNTTNGMPVRAPRENIN